jgi:hypothetical protein
MTDHQRYRELAATQLDFPLQRREELELAEHLAACASCRDYAALLRADADTVGSLPQVDAPPHVAANVRAGRSRRGRGTPMLALAAAVSLIALVGVGAFGVGSPRASEQPSTVPDGTAFARASTPPASPTSTDARSGPLGWERVDDQASFRAPVGVMEAVVAGGPGLVAVGDGCSKALPRCHAAVWTSSDGHAWTRVKDSGVFDVGTYPAGRWGEMTDIIAGGPGLIAVGREALESGQGAVVWTSPDGSSWTRLPNSSDFDHGTIEAVTPGGPGYVAVGTEINGAKAVAAVYTSPDGVAWHQGATIPDFDLGGPGTFNDGRTHGAMTDVVTSHGIVVAVGSVCAPSGGSCRAAVWTSPDGMTWKRVPDSAAFDGNMYAATVWRDGFLAVGDDGHDKVPRAWSSADGVSWTRSPDVVGLDGAFSAVITLDDRLVASAVTRDLKTSVFESVDGIDWTVSEPSAVLGAGAINGFGAGGPTELTAVGWDGVTPAAEAWSGQR